ncbi:MAG: DNA translocase FtsK 4TM domain-containing protein [Candidatus Kerfeldbacteria bacterium]|nr:DNA translocase FtsK 4TM domain-containing protein [Candidatus Kerfeldbacteria bacterium]
MAQTVRESSAGRRRGGDQPPKRRPESLKPETRHGITVVVMFTLAVLLFLSLFDLAGILGSQINNLAVLLLGGWRYFVPIIFVVLGITLLVPDRIPLRSSSYIGLVLFLLSGSALLFVPVSQDMMVQAVADGRGGGYLGLALAYPLRSLTGSLASAVILIALVIISALVMFNTTLSSLAERGTFIGAWYGNLQAWWYRWKYRLERQRHVDEAPSVSEQNEEQMVDRGEGGFESRRVGPAVLEPPSLQQRQLWPSAVVPRRRRKLDIPLDLLDQSDAKPSGGQIEEKRDRIRKTLETFGIVVEMDKVNVGPTVTQFTLKPAEGVKLSQITTLQNDLALALAAHPIRIEAPIPGMSLVGIEVPNESIAIVSLRDILDSEEFKKRISNLTFSLGKDVAGKPWTANLDPMPHLLIAGATGSGKSVMMNTLIISLLYANSPDDLKFILIDPKRVEFSVYNDLPHLLTPVITETAKTVNALRWIVGEMDRRFRVLSGSGKRDIKAYHRDVDDGMPYIVVVIDELADLMAVAAQEVEGAITRLAQMARAVGIHLVVATQRPSVNVITGLIKANITARIGFNVASSVDSRTILDTAGAEKLLGKGDMLYISSELSKPKRLQAAYLSDQEIIRVVQHLKTQAQPEYVTEVTEKLAPQSSFAVEDFGDDELLNEAKELILRAGKASASLLQRRLRIGYARAARILDLLEERGIIGPGEGAKPREILISREGFANQEPGEGLPDDDGGAEPTDEVEDIPEQARDDR